MGKEAAAIRDTLNILLELAREEHDNCPAGESSWCYYQKQVALCLMDKSLPTPYTRSPYLTANEYKRAREVFDVPRILWLYHPRKDPEF